MTSAPGIIPVVDFHVYETATGRILWSGSMRQDHVPLQAGEGSAAAEGAANDLEQWVEDGVLTARPVLPISDAVLTVGGGEQTVAAGLPAGTVVSVDGAEPVEVEDGAITLEPMEPIAMTLRLTPPFPYSPATITVAAA